MVSFSLRQRILFTSSVDTRSVSFHLSQFAGKSLRSQNLALDGDLMFDQTHMPPRMKENLW